MKKTIGYYSEYEYTVEIDGKEVYRAGNSPFDSQVYVRDLGNYAVVPLATMKEYCDQTTRELAKENKASFVGIEYNEDSI